MPIRTVNMIATTTRVPPRRLLLDFDCLPNRDGVVVIMRMLLPRRARET